MSFFFKGGRGYVTKYCKIQHGFWVYMVFFRYISPMKSRKVKILIYCLCEMCGKYFEVSGVKRSKYCGRSCRDRDYYVRKHGLDKK